MKRYETIVIIDPDLPKEAETPLFDRVNHLIPQYEGFLIETDDWGTKKLAYEIKKKSRGHYVRLDFCGDGALIQEMERFFRIDDKVLKFMTVLLDEDVDLEAIKADIEQSADSPAAASAADGSPERSPTVEEPAAAETAEQPANSEASTEMSQPVEAKEGE